MSLWQKWENDKRRAAGLPVEHDVEYHDSYLKHNFKRDIMIVFAAVGILAAIAFGSIVIESTVMNKKWSDTMIIRLLAARGAQREEIAKEQQQRSQLP